MPPLDVRVEARAHMLDDSHGLTEIRLGSGAWSPFGVVEIPPLREDDDE